MKRSALVVTMLVVVVAPSLFADTSNTLRALKVAKGVLDRAIAAGSEEIVPKQALRGARLEDVYTIHDPETLEPAYDLVLIRSGAGLPLGVVAVEAGSDRWLWCTFNYRHDRFPPVSRLDAGRRVAGHMHTLGVGGETEAPILVRGGDKHVYWRFGSADGESWLVDAVESDAPILTSRDGSDLKVLCREAARLGSQEPEPDFGGEPGILDSETQVGEPTAAYVLPGIPYHFQIIDWYCGPASLQMIMDYLGPEIGQHDIGDVANEHPSYGTMQTDMRRAAHFSGMSLAIQDSSLQGYAERQLGYACMENKFFTNAAYRLKKTVYAQFPVFVLTWYDPPPSSGHYRVVKGYDDSLDVFVLHDPWYAWDLCGPDLLINQTVFVDELWTYSSRWAMVVTPWELTPTVPAAVAQGDTFTVGLEIVYPGPTRFANQFPCSSCTATISLSSGLSLVSDSATVGFPSLVSRDTANVSWDVVAVGPEGEWGMAFQAQGIVKGSSVAYASYTDSIGGHAYETVMVTGGLVSVWGAEERLTEDYASSQTCFPGGRAMVVSDDGTVHLVWAEARDDTCEIYYRRRTGYTWGSETRLTHDLNFSHNPCIGQSGDGCLHVAWMDSRDGNHEIYYKRWDPVGGWSSDERVTVYSEVDYNPSIAAGDSTVYLVWERRLGGAYRSVAVHLAIRSNLGWSVPVDVDNSPARDSYRPSVAVGRDGLVHVVYERQTADDPDEKEEIIHRSWDGMAWSGHASLSSNVSFSRGPVVAVGSDSTVHVVWQDGENLSGDIFYAWHDGTSWQPTEEIVTGGTEASTPSVAVDGEGEVHVAWVDDRHGDSEIYMISKGVSGWGEETRLTEASGGSLLPTVAANAAGQVCVVWTDLRDGNAEIYFNYMLRSGVEVESVSHAAHGRLHMSQPRPMPFTSETGIAFWLAEPSEVSLDVFDVNGRLVRTLAGGTYGAGTHDVVWDGRGSLGERVAPGVYFVRCAGPLGQDVRPIVLVR